MKIGPVNISLARGKSLPAQLQGTRGWDSLWKWLFPNKWIGASSVWGTPEAKDMEQAYAVNPVVLRCATIIADTVPTARLELGAWIGSEWKPMKQQTHPAVQLLDNPNPDYSRSDFFRFTVSRAALTGFGYVWKLRGGRRVTELWPVPTSWVEPLRPTGQQTISRLISGYRLYQQNIELPPEDMIVVRLIDPGSTACAISPMDSAWHDFRLDLARQDYQAEMLTNMKVPGMKFKFPNIPSADQQKQIEAQIESRFGEGNRGKTAVLWGGGDMEAMNPLADLDWPGITSLNEIRICVAFGVPPILLHLRAGLDRATYSNYEQARQSFFQLTMASWWDIIADSLTRGLLRQEGETRLQFRFRYDELPEFQEDTDMKSARVVGEYASGLITLDEARDILGYGPAPLELIEAAKPPVEIITDEGDGDGDDEEAENENDDAGEKDKGNAA